MLELCRKKSMARHLGALAARLPRYYAFAPAAFALPEQLGAWRGALRKGRTWIVKPDAGCQGKGIVLVQTAKQAAQARDTGARDISDLHALTVQYSL
jgi:tubulin polyglutamylase TTLL6/13